MKKTTKIILPTEDGIANLEIRRIQHELEKDRPQHSCGMPEEASERMIDDLENCIASIKRGGVSSICLAYMGPDVHEAAQGVATIITERSEVEELGSIVMAALASRIGQGPDDEAG